jgi:DNA topoisomerase-6 subunit B
MDETSEVDETGSRTSAEEIFKDFKSLSPSEFFRKNPAMLGLTGKIKSLSMIVHEGVTNSLDAAEEAGVLPDIYIYLDRLNGDNYYKLTIEDNGSGIPEPYIADVFGKMLAGTKHRFVQRRGQQGIGISGATMFAQMTSGSPIHIYTSTGRKIIGADLKIDVKRNEGKLTGRTEYPTDGFRGTRIEFYLKKVLYNKSKQGPLAYLKMSAIANPHATITMVSPDGELFRWDRSITGLPRKPKEIRPHPYGITADDLLTLARASDNRNVSGMIAQSLCRVSPSKIGQIRLGMALGALLKRFEEYQTDEVKRTLSEAKNIGERVRYFGKILSRHKHRWESALKEEEKKAARILKKRPSQLRFDEAEAIVESFGYVKFLSPPTAGLSPIGQDNIMKGLNQILRPEFVYAVTRNPTTSRGGIPFVVEVGIAYGGYCPSNIDVIRFANRAPLMFDSGGCVITEATKSIDWRRYGVREVDTAPLTIFTNIVSTFVPYTSTGKQAIASEEDVLNEIRMGLMDVARNLKRHLHHKRRIFEKASRRSSLLKYVEETAGAIAKLSEHKQAGIKENLERLVDKKFV